MALGRLLVASLLPAAALSLKPLWPPGAPDPVVYSSTSSASSASSTSTSSLSVFNITSYGAVADNATLCTSSIQAAIDAAAAAGGGLVRVPPGGAFRTGALTLASNTYLYLPDGAVLQACVVGRVVCTRETGEGRGGGPPAYSLISALTSLSSLSLSPQRLPQCVLRLCRGGGLGPLGCDSHQQREQHRHRRGCGRERRDLGAHVADGERAEEERGVATPHAAPHPHHHTPTHPTPHTQIDDYDPSQNQLEPVTWAGLYGCEGECRPRLAVFEDCQDVILANVRLENSADWTTLFRRVRGLTWANVTVWGSQQWPNNDGVDLESCTDVYFGNVSIFTGDDSICLASGNTNNMKNPWPEPAGNYTPCANILIENVTLSSYSSAFKLEAIFQASHGHVENVTLRNARILASNRGIGMQQRTGYGAFRNISFVNVSVEARAIAGTNWWGLGEAIWLTSVPENDNLAETLGGIHGVSFVNVDTVSEQGVVVAARNLGNGTDPSPAISGLSFANVTVVVAALGNETRSYGVHDFRPLDVGQAEVNASVSGFWFEHVGPTTVSGGGVFFAGPLQPAWEAGVCRDGTPDSVVSFSGVACEPAAGADLL
jgi:polygalacturonase